MVKYGLTILIGFNLFTGCVHVVSSETEEYYVTFNMRLPLDLNGYYHLTLDRSNWQTFHRVEGVATDNNDNFVQGFWVEWDSDLYWVLGDTLGYIINRYLNNSGVYVSVDTSYIMGFSGVQVPTTNVVSYSNGYGQLNNMIAPVLSMVGDTLILTAVWWDGQRSFSIVLD